MIGGDASSIKVVLIRQVSNLSPEVQSELYQVIKTLRARIVAPGLWILEVQEISVLAQQAHCPIG